MRGWLHQFALADRRQLIERRVHAIGYPRCVGRVIVFLVQCCDTMGHISGAVGNPPVGGMNSLRQ